MQIANELPTKRRSNLASCIFSVLFLIFIILLCAQAGMACTVYKIGSAYRLGLRRAIPAGLDSSTFRIPRLALTDRWFGDPPIPSRPICSWGPFFFLSKRKTPPGFFFLSQATAWPGCHRSINDCKASVDGQKGVKEKM